MDDFVVTHLNKELTHGNYIQKYHIHQREESMSANIKK